MWNWDDGWKVLISLALALAVLPWLRRGPRRPHTTILLLGLTSVALVVAVLMLMRLL